VLVVQRGPGGGRAELPVEAVHGLEEGGVVVGVDDGDGLAGAVQGQVVDAVGRADLGRRVHGRASAGQTVDDRVAADDERADDVGARELASAAGGHRSARRVDHTAGDADVVSGQSQRGRVVARLEEEHAGIDPRGDRREVDVADTAPVDVAEGAA